MKPTAKARVLLLDEVLKNPALMRTCDEETRDNVLEQMTELLRAVAQRLARDGRADQEAGDVTEAPITETMCLWVNENGDMITLENQDLTDEKDYRLQILQFREDDGPATEIILGPSDLQELRDAIED